jgi:hypothetical protein
VWASPSLAPPTPNTAPVAGAGGTAPLSLPALEACVGLTGLGGALPDAAGA